MLHQCLSRTEIHPRLPRSGTEIALRVYARPHTGALLADDGSRWGVLILPGGGYRCTAPGEGEPTALALLAAGVQAFVLEYSVCPAAWPQPFLEAAAALAWMRAHAHDLGIRPDRIAVCGFSAGGHLAGCLSNLWADPVIGEALGLAPEQVRPDRAILCYPVVSARLDTSGSIRRIWGGDHPPEALSLERSVSPATPPTFLWSTWTDQSVPADNTLCYAQALRAAGVPCELHLYGWGPHAMGTATAEAVWRPGYVDPHAATWLPLCLEWLKQEGIV